LRQPCLDLSISGDRLTLHARKVPLQEILHGFARLGIAVQADQRLNPEVTVSFEGADIRRALNTIIHPYSSVLIWKSVPGPLGPLPALAEIRIFEPGRKSGMRYLDAGGGLAVARDPRSGTLYVVNELLVKVGAGISPRAFSQLLAQVHGTLVDANAALGIYRIRVPEGSHILSLVDGINRGSSGVRAEPNLAWPLVPSYRFRGNPSPETPPLPENSSGSGKAPVAVLDSGLLPGVGVDPYVVASLDSTDPADPISDPLGHGTLMAMIAAGLVAPYGAAAPCPASDAELGQPEIVQVAEAGGVEFRPAAGGQLECRKRLFVGGIKSLAAKHLAVGRHQRVTHDVVLLGHAVFGLDGHLFAVHGHHGRVGTDLGGPLAGVFGGVDDARRQSAARSDGAAGTAHGQAGRGQK
jgi:hypothetical protein